MNSTVIQYLQSGYLSVAFVVALGAAVLADRLRVGDAPALPTRCAAAALMGAMWPVTIIGVAQFWGFSKLADRRRPTADAAEPAPQLVLAAGSH